MLAPVLTGNAELQELLHSRTVDLPRGKKLAHDVLHPRKVQLDDRRNELYRMAHKLLVFFFREIIVLSNGASGEILTIPSSVAKNGRADFL